VPTYRVPGSECLLSCSRLNDGSEGVALVGGVQQLLAELRFQFVKPPRSPSSAECTVERAAVGLKRPAAIRSAAVAGFEPWAS